MRLASASVLVIAVIVGMASAGGTEYQDSDRKIAGGGIAVPGWQGRVDPAAAREGLSVADSKFTQQGNALHLTVGPAANYWNPANSAKGDYTVKATFREPKQTFSHPHPFGLFIGGSKLDTDQANLLYCVAYRDGTFVVRQFTNGTVSTLARKQPSPSISKAADPEAEVRQEIAWTVKGDRVECSVNGTMVAGFSRADVVGPGKFQSTDGIAGLRVSHNSDVIVTNFAVTK